MKYVQVFDKTRLTMTDAKGNIVPFDYLTAVSVGDSIKALIGESNAAVKASVAAISQLIEILDSKRLDGYRGKTPIGEKLPKELNEAIRDLETSYLQPKFVEFHDKTHQKACMAHEAAHKTGKSTPYGVERDTAWDSFRSSLRSGSWAHAKSTVTQYFAYTGKLPCAYSGENPDKSKLLPVAAIAKMIANLKTDMVKAESGGIADSLVKLSAEMVDAKTDTKALGNYPTAIAALKSMLAKYEALETELQLALSKNAQPVGIDEQAKQALAKMVNPTGQALTDALKAEMATI